MSDERFFLTFRIDETLVVFFVEVVVVVVLPPSKYVVSQLESNTCGLM